MKKFWVTSLLFLSLGWIAVTFSGTVGTACKGACNCAKDTQYCNPVWASKTDWWGSITLYCDTSCHACPPKNNCGANQIPHVFYTNNNQCLQYRCETINVVIPR